MSVVSETNFWAAQWRDLETREGAEAKSEHDDDIFRGIHEWRLGTRALYDRSAK